MFFYLQTCDLKQVDTRQRWSFSDKNRIFAQTSLKSDADGAFPLWRRTKADKLQPLFFNATYAATANHFSFFKEPLTIDSDYVLMYENYAFYLGCFAYLAGANAGQTAPGCVPNLPQIVFPIMFAMAYLWAVELQCNLTISGVVWGELIIRVKAQSKQGLWGECSSESSCGGNTSSWSLQLQRRRA